MTKRAVLSRKEMRRGIAEEWRGNFLYLLHIFIAQEIITPKNSFFTSVGV
jgi:hypothetical protein